MSEELEFSLFELLRAGPPPSEEVTKEAYRAMVLLIREHGITNAFCALGALISELLETSGGIQTEYGPCPNVEPQWDAMGVVVLRILKGLCEYCRSDGALERAGKFYARASREN